MLTPPGCPNNLLVSSGLLHFYFIHNPTSYFGLILIDCVKTKVLILPIFTPVFFSPWVGTYMYIHNHLFT